MAKWPKIYYVFILILLIVALTGCELRRDSSEVSDPGPVSELPTLAPLGAESADEPAGEATAVPTVINVQATATESSPVEGEAASVSDELTAPTSQPASIPASPAADTSQAEEAVVEPETFTPPTEEPISAEPVVVDATTEELPEGGPIAADPPASQISGDYAAPTYDTTYIVQPGDTLFSIGLRYGTTVEAILYANGLTSDVIYVGQELIIPADDGSYYPPVYEPAVPIGSETYHVVVPGETLFRIALNYGSSVEAIAGANGIPYPYIIQVGQELLIPAHDTYAGPPPPPPEGFYQPNPEYLPQEPPVGGYYPSPPDGSYGLPGGANTHTVAPGETLFSIAQRYGLTAEAIASANGLSNPDQIYVGQVLYLP